MIATVTLNAALDHTLVAPRFRVGESRTVAPALVLGGGKGINLARALRCLDIPVIALGFAGGQVGERIRGALDKEGLPHALTPISAESRICTAIIDPESGMATEVNEAGPVIQPEERAAFVRLFDQTLGRASMVTLCGGLPPGLPTGFYAELITRATEQGVPCLLDTRGPPLRAGAAASPLLAKPNREESAQLLGAPLASSGAALNAKDLPSPGPRLLCVTLGAEGAALYTPIGSWRACPPPVRVLDTVGAGDAFLAGLAAALYRAMADEPAREQPWLERATAVIARPPVLESMLRLATAVSAASILILGAGRCDSATIERLLPCVEIRKL